MSKGHSSVERVRVRAALSYPLGTVSNDKLHTISALCVAIVETDDMIRVISTNARQHPELLHCAAYLEVDIKMGSHLFNVSLRLKSARYIFIMT